MDAVELEENWKRACRTDELTRRFPEPVDQLGLVQHVLNRVRGGGQPPDPIVVGAATGFASSDYESSGEARYLQLAMLVKEAAKDASADHRAAIDILALVGQAAVGLLVSTWRGEAEVDELTRLGNRRKMEALVGAFVIAGTRFAYASIDADGLKQINDNEGHAAGDDFLRDLGEELRRSALEVSGQAFRYGGDEFGVVVALQAEDDVLSQVIVDAQGRFATSGRSFSAGIAIWPDVDDDHTSVIGTADRRMYDQKQAKKAQSTNATDAGMPSVQPTDLVGTSESSSGSPPDPVATTEAADETTR
ncbi:GGDEF domain-containing protein [Microbacterium sp. LWH11-1.2]|uniref:GGDEF domain-containing protein n=1 Tax=Microbacterium sp. LWH11-1.2 TaxID=3135258 RepID=UPI0031395DAF